MDKKKKVEENISVIKKTDMYQNLYYSSRAFNIFSCAKGIFSKIDFM